MEYSIKGKRTYKRRKRRNTCCKIFIKYLNIIGLHIYNAYENNKDTIFYYLTKCKTSICKYRSHINGKCLTNIMQKITHMIVKSVINTGMTSFIQNPYKQKLTDK
ncbi:hypothetical protein FPV019 [Fowlpox virus]|uniref:Uncharacterized protein n=2 Tax=Fowlpox virus TaxID=10261 RepID=Q9J5I2_FOWPN|nr:hypothetical protein FPV019 [Fowlpox virus]UNS14200.1 ALPV-036 [Albatrosspox virus]WPD90970.1 hypothetical protein PPV_Vac110-fpv019 [Avipoxvirus sp.]CAE52565.1 hypothetical protein [Fowlpox virus isolate HP-438/Munich]AAF44363.1 ORF FPV019 hypothetical protein [Fowlpox virus]ART91453.1 hypothetical protein [Fowlpox virus]